VAEVANDLANDTREGLRLAAVVRPGQGLPGGCQPGLHLSYFIIQGVEPLNHRLFTGF
jgi:hypothetical protein